MRLKDGSWIKSSLVAALRILFPNDWRFYDYVFLEFSSVAVFLLIEVRQGLATKRLNFTDVVVDVSWSLERLFRVLDVFEAIREMLMELENLILINRGPKKAVAPGAWRWCLSYHPLLDELPLSSLLVSTDPGASFQRQFVSIEGLPEA